MSEVHPLNREICLSTDIASFFIFHPDDLKHRLNAPLGWSSSEFACRKEFDAGRLVTWSTGSDGSSSFRVTTGKLTQRELQWLLKSWDFRLRVTRERVLLDGGLCLPADAYCDMPKEDHPGWIDLPNGDYRVTVHDINWSGESGAVDENGYAHEGSLTSYVIEFVPVEDIQMIRVASNTAPKLYGEPGRDYTKYSDDDSDKFLYQEDRSPLVPGRLVLLETPNWLVLPDCLGREDITEQLQREITGQGGESPGLVITNNAIVRQHAMLCQLRSCGRGWYYESLHVTFKSRRLVRIVELKNKRASWVNRLFRIDASQVRIESVERSFAEAPCEELAQLQARFANYAAHNPWYLAEVKHAEYEAEGFAWLTTTEGITNRLLDLLQISAPQKLQLFLLPPPERIAPLLAILEHAGY
jgi:hypothetical protein